MSVANILHSRETCKYTWVHMQEINLTDVMNVINALSYSQI